MRVDALAQGVRAVARNRISVPKAVGAAQIEAPAGWQTSTGNRVRPLVDREQVLPAVLTAIQGAQHSIDVQSYLFGGDMGMQIAHALIARKEEGLQVRVLLHPKFTTVGHDDHEAAIHTLQQAGVDVRAYPLDVLPAHEPLNFGGHVAHAKAVIVDGGTAVVGGMNLSESGGHAHDFMVQVEGPAAGRLGADFNDDWQVAGGAAPVMHAVRSAARVAGGATVTIARTDPTHQDIQSLVASQLRSATKSITMEALFLDDPAYVRELLAAKARGVDVKILLDQSAIPYFGGQYVPPAKELIRRLPIGTLADMQVLPVLQAAHIPVHLFVPHDGKDYLHAKLAVIDGERTLIGSANFTLQAAHNNLELMLAVHDRGTAQGFAKTFANDWAHHSVAAPPVTPWQRALGGLLGRIHSLTFGGQEGQA